MIFAIRFISGEAVFERASRRGDVLVFRPVLGLRFLFGIGITVILLTISEEGIHSSTLPWDAIAVAMIIVLFTIWPGTIIVDHTSVRETRWFALKRTRILWGDVVFAGVDVENSVTVRAKDGRTIQHTQYHVGRAAFIGAVKQNCEKCSYKYPAPKPWVPRGSR